MTDPIRFPLALVVPTEPWTPNDGWYPPEPQPTDLYVLDYTLGDSPETDDYGPLLEVTESPADDGSPTWDAEGRVLFISDRDGPRGVFAAHPGQRRPRLVLDEPRVVEIAACPDGRRFAYTVGSPEGHEVWTASVDGSDLRRALGPSPGLHGVRYAPDGALLLSEADGLYRLDPETGERSLLAAEPLQSPSLSPDGRHLAYVEGGDLHLRDLAKGRDRILARADLDGECGFPAFSPDGSRLFFCRMTTLVSEDHLALMPSTWVTTPQGGKPVQLVLNERSAIQVVPAALAQLEQQRSGLRTPVPKDDAGHALKLPQTR